MLVASHDRPGTGEAAMITTRRRSHLLGRLVATALLAEVAMTPASIAAGADASRGAEFERITADIRAAVARHDARLYHLYLNQLERLVDQATDS
jgi:hypothetical protein